MRLRDLASHRSRTQADICPQRSTKQPLVSLMPKILIVSSVFPFPADTGKKIVLGGFLEYFKSRFGQHNVEWLYVGNEFPAAASSLIRFHAVHLPSSFWRLASVFRYALIGGTKSIQEAILYTDQLASAVRSQIIAINPDLIMWDTVRAAQYGVPDEYMGRSVLYLEDLFSERYKRMLDSLNRGGVDKLNVLGNFTAFIPGFLRPLAQRFRVLQRMLLKLEKHLIERSEVAFSARFKWTILLNNDEAKLLSKRSSQAHVMAAKPILPSPARDSFRRRYDGGFTFVFIGALNYASNEAALMAFVDQVLPLIVKLAPQFKFRIIGKNASEQLIAKLDQFPRHIQLEGFVPDLTGVFATCCGIIVPLTFGTGIKLKTLEALSYGVPLISTSIGVEGIRVTHGRHCIIEDDLAKYPQWMISLRDLDRNESFSREARDYFSANYSKDRVFIEYDAIFRKVEGTSLLPSVVETHAQVFA
jgi:glycosyltransferase involved in cell wall biosynthesis